MKHPPDPTAALRAQTLAYLREELDMGAVDFPIVGPGTARPRPASQAPAPRADAPPPAMPPAEGEGLAPDERRRRLDSLEERVRGCVRCRLHEGRTQTVFARGNPAGAAVAFVGEGPGFHEDQRGQPFVGKAGQLLDKMIAAMGLTQDEVYICNVVKCRPPENRTPNPDEAATCMPYLREQLGLVRPAAIVALGRCAAENLGAAEAGKKWRGEWSSWEGVPLMATYHPAYLLRNAAMKKPVWEDLKAVIARLGRALPPRGPRG